MRNALLVSLLVDKKNMDLMKSSDDPLAKDYLTYLHQGLSKAADSVHIFPLAETQELAKEMLNVHFHGNKANYSEDYDVASEISKLFHGIVADYVLKLEANPKKEKLVSDLLAKVDINNTFKDF